MGSIKHYILTRFNVATPGRWEDIRLRPGWLDKRYDLFTEFCLPGVAGQTRKDFEWIIFFDAQTPPEYMSRIEALQSIFPFRIVQTPLFEMKDMCQQLCKERAESAWLLTTRLDSDDILADDFVERLRQDLQPRTHHAINFPNGLIFSIQGKKRALYKDRDESGPFSSLLEPFTDDIETVWAAQHRYIDALAPILQASPAPAWLQVVHGDNISNHIRGVRVRMADYAPRFPYLASLQVTRDEKPSSVLWENFTLTPFRFLKEALRGLAKKVLARR